MERPANVPADAIWSDSDNEWVLASLDDSGRKHGTTRYFRPDGTLCCVTEYEAGQPHGSFRRTHENGETSREGRFERGSLEGTNVFLRTDGPTSEVFPPGLSDAIWRCEMDYQQNRIVAGRLYDRAGQRVREDGSPYPMQAPEGVPANAYFGTRADEPRWIVGTTLDRNDGTIQREGAWRYYTEEGALAVEEHYREGEVCQLHEFHANGALAREVEQQGGKAHGFERTFDAEGRPTAEFQHREGEKHGSFFRVLEPGELTLPEAVRMVGRYEEDELVGELQLLDAADAIVHRVQCGRGADETQVERMLLAPGSSDFAQLAETLRGEGYLDAALVACARAVGRGASPALWTDMVREVRVPMGPEGEATITQMAVHVMRNMQRFGAAPERSCSYLFRQLRQGGAPTELLFRCAVLLDQLDVPVLSATGLDLIDAARALEPSNVSMEFSRALLLVSAGRPADALLAARTLATEDDARASFLRSYVRGLFPEYAFWPASDGRLGVLGRMPGGHQPCVRDLAAVTSLANRLASRVRAHHDALVGLVADPSWLPAPLVGFATERVELEETSVPQLATALRRDWLLLGWLLWLAGSDAMTLPTAVARRPAGSLLALTLARLSLLNGDDLDADKHALLELQTWCGMPLEALDETARQTAADDENALLTMAMWACDLGTADPLEVEDEAHEEEEDEDEDE